MLTFYKKYGRTAFDIFLIIVTVLLIMYLFSFLYNIGKPIFMAFIIYLMIEPLARFLHKKGLKKFAATTISTLLFVLVVLGIMVIIGVIFTTQILHLANTIPSYINFLKVELLNKADYIKDQIDALPPDVVEEGKIYLNEVANKSSSFLSTTLKGIYMYLISFSGFLLNFTVNFIIGLILAFFLSIEIADWRRLAKEKTPNTFKKAFYFLRENVIKGIVSYIKAQLKLISMTFIIIFIGLLVLGISNAFSVSLLAAFFDVLPVLGVSTLFVPWIIYLLIVGQTSTALWLTGLLTIVIVFRQIAEPKVVGDSLGVSAFTMLAFMVISLSLFGVAGIILSPVLLILIKALYEQGYLKRWIHMPEDEYGVENEVEV